MSRPTPVSTVEKLQTALQAKAKVAAQLAVLAMKSRSLSGIAAMPAFSSV